MHKWAKTMAECLKNEIEAIGMNNLSSEQICDVKNWSEIIKNITCYDKDYKIIEAMDKAEHEDNMDMIEQYTDYPVKHYRGRMRDSRGRFMYTETPYVNDPMQNDMRNYSDGMHNNSMNRGRDMDVSRGRMYYTESSSRLEETRKKLQEHLEKHDTSAEGKQKELKLAGEMADAIKEFLTTNKSMFSNEAKTAINHKFVEMAESVMR